MTGLANPLVDLLAGHVALGRIRFGQRDLAHRFDAAEHTRFGVFGRARPYAGDELREQNDERDRHCESQHHNHDKLLRRLDEGGVLVTHRAYRGSPRGICKVRPTASGRETKCAL